MRVLLGLRDLVLDVEQVVLEHAEPDDVQEEDVDIGRLGGEQLLVERDRVVQRRRHLVDLGFVAGLGLPGVGGLDAEIVIGRAAEDRDRIRLGRACGGGERK